MSAIESCVSKGSDAKPICTEERTKAAECDRYTSDVDTHVLIILPSIASTAAAPVHTRNVIVAKGTW